MQVVLWTRRLCSERYAKWLRSQTKGSCAFLLSYIVSLRWFKADKGDLLSKQYLCSRLHITILQEIRVIDLMDPLNPIGEQHVYDHIGTYTIQHNFLFQDRTFLTVKKRSNSSRSSFAWQPLNGQLFYRFFPLKRRIEHN